MQVKLVREARIESMISPQFELVLDASSSMKDPKAKIDKRLKIDVATNSHWIGGVTAQATLC